MSSYALFGEGGGDRLAAEIGVPVVGRIPLHPDDGRSRRRGKASRLRRRRAAGAKRSRSSPSGCLGTSRRSSTRRRAPPASSTTSSGGSASRVNWRSVLAVRTGRVRWTGRVRCTGLARRRAGPARRFRYAPDRGLNLLWREVRRRSRHPGPDRLLVVRIAGKDDPHPVSVRDDPREHRRHVLGRRGGLEELVGRREPRDRLEVLHGREDEVELPGVVAGRGASAARSRRSRPSRSRRGSPSGPEARTPRRSACRTASAPARGLSSARSTGPCPRRGSTLARWQASRKPTRFAFTSTLNRASRDSAASSCGR